MMKKLENLLKKINPGLGHEENESIASRFITQAVKHRVSEIYLDVGGVCNVTWRTNGELIHVARLSRAAGRALATWFRVEADLRPIVKDQPLVGFTEVEIPGDHVPVKVVSRRDSNIVRTSLRLLHPDCRIVALNSPRSEMNSNVMTPSRPVDQNFPRRKKFVLAG